MNLATLFERLAARQKQRAKTQVDGYRELIKAIAAGQEPNAEDVEQVLGAAGKSLDDLREAVELYQRRSTMRKLIDSLPQLEKEYLDLQKQVHKADTALEAAQRKYDETTAPLKSRMEEIRWANLEAEEYQQQLIATCPYDELRKQLKDLEREHGAAHDRAIKLREDMNNYRQWAKADRADAEHATPTLEQELLARAAAREKKVADWEKELSAVTKQCDTIEQQISAVYQAMQEP